MRNDKVKGTQTPLRQSFRYFKRLIGLIKPFWFHVGKGMILGPIIGLLTAAIPYLSKLLFDTVYPTGSIGLMEIIVFGILAITIASGFANIMLEYYTSYINAKLNSVFNLFFLNHLQHLPSSFFVKHQVGEIKSRFNDGLDSLSAITSAVQVIFGQGIYLFIIPPFLFLMNWKLALIALLAVPITSLITIMSGKYLRSSWKDVAESHADFEALQMEVLNQVNTFKGLGLEHYNYKRGERIQQRVLKSHLKAHLLNSSLGISDRFLNAINVALFTWLGWTYIIEGNMTLGDYIAFTAYVGYLYQPFSLLIGLFTSFQHSAVNLNRVYEYLDTIPEQDPKQAYKVPDEIRVPIKGKIAFQHVNFSYKPEIPILKDLQLTLQDGKFYGLVGSSGSGKTTLLKLISRFEEPIDGIIQFDGARPEDIPLVDFRRQVAIVWQEVQLIKGTIWENLTLGLDNVPQSEVDEVIRITRLEEMIDAQPEGFQTVISEWGSSLSGGQKQRFAIARALIRKPRILILDEATSNLDLPTEFGLIKDLSVFTKAHQITTIFVTHRLKSLQNVDEICLLHNGEIIAQSSYSELMAKSTMFQEMISYTENSTSDVH